MEREVEFPHLFNLYFGHCLLSTRKILSLAPSPLIGVAYSVIMPVVGLMRNTGRLIIYCD